GTTTWSRGTGTQVDLAACLEDKTTCNAQDATEASWNSSWLSATRYATTTQTTTAPGSLGTFSYNVAAPPAATAGTYRFNGDLVLSTTGEKIHPDGYYQDATIGGGGGGAATLTGISPTFGSTSGGTAVTLTGTGFVCTPAFPSVAFGATNAAVNSCGGTSIGVTSPAHVAGSVTVTVTNSGQAASNGLSFLYQDTTPPQFTGQSTASNVVTVTYSKPVCRTIAFNAAQAPSDWTVKNVTFATPDAVTADNTPVCNTATAPTNGVTTANLFLATSIPPGAFVEVDLNVFNSVNPSNTTGACVNATTCNTNFIDAAGNTIVAPQAQTATATSSPTGAPTIVSASGAVGASSVTINFSQAVWCNQPTFNNGGNGNFTLNSFQAGVTDPTFTVAAVNGGATKCFADTNSSSGNSQQTAGTPMILDTSIPLPSNTTYTLTYNGPTGAVK